MDIVIAGAGEVGSHLAKRLVEQNHHVTVIDPDAYRLERLGLDTDIVSVAGSSTSFEVLHNSHMSKADLLIAVTPSQDANIVTCMLAKKMGVPQTVARIDHTEYFDPQHRPIFAKAGVDFMFYPEDIASNEIGNLIRQTYALEYLDFSGGRMTLMGFKLEAGSRMIGRTLGKCREAGQPLMFRTVAIVRKQRAIIPSPTEVFALDDYIYVIAIREHVNDVLSLVGRTNIEVRRMMILGGSRIGVKVAQMLEGRVNIKMVEQDRAKCQQLSGLLNKTMMIHGDGRNSGLLLAEGITKTDAFVAVTGNSETNILACLFAKQMGVGRTIAEIENVDYIELAGSIGVDTIINKKLITTGHILSFAQNTDVRHLTYLTGCEGGEVLEYIAKPGSRATQYPVEQLGITAKRAFVCGVMRAGGITAIPTSGYRIEPYDHVVVIALAGGGIKSISALFN